VDRGPRTTRRRAAHLNRRAYRPQQSWHATPIIGPLWPGLVWVWGGRLVGLLVRAGPGIPAAWPALDRPRTRAYDAVSPRLDDRDLEDDPPSVLTRWTTAVRGRPPATLEGHAAVMPSHRWPSRYLVRPQLLTRLSPLPNGEGPPYLHRTRGDRTACGGTSPPHARAMAVSVRPPGPSAAGEAGISPAPGMTDAVIYRGADDESSMAPMLTRTCGTHRTLGSHHGWSAPLQRPSTPLVRPRARADAGPREACASVCL
jgi:hypothetical protein